ncbi:MAG TPA: PKD domain-containing protein, partial [Anaerolineae bacterium]|nr:PKD domain-containing protein [Anaerolineae bacterium]
MTWGMKNFIGIFLLVNIVLSGCGEDSTGPGNNPPTSNAGADQTVNVGDTVTLNGSASSDPDGGSIIYLWSFVNRPPGSTATLSGAASVSATFIADAAGTYTVRLTVSDGEKSASDNVIVTAEAVTSPVELSGNIDTDTHLLDIFDDPNAIDYILTSVVNVTAKLTIDPGVRISVSSSKGLDIETGGLIIAVGTEEKPIIFTGEVATPGYWNGIYIASNDPENELTFVEVAHGGGGDYANVYVKYTGQLKLTNCTLSESSTYGMEAQNGAKLPAFSNNAFQLNQEAALRVPASLVGSLDSESVYAGSNVKEYIEVFSSNVET